MHIQLKHILNEMLYEFRYNVNVKRITDLEVLIRAYVGFYSTVITRSPDEFRGMKKTARYYIEEYIDGGPHYVNKDSYEYKEFMELARIWVRVGKRDVSDYDKYIGYIEELFNIENTSKSMQDYDLEYSDWSARLKAEMAKNGETVQQPAINDPFL